MTAKRPVPSKAGMKALHALFCCVAINDAGNHRRKDSLASCLLHPRWSCDRSPEIPPRGLGRRLDAWGWKGRLPGSGVLHILEDPFHVLHLEYQQREPKKTVWFIRSLIQMDRDILIICKLLRMRMFMLCIASAMFRNNDISRSAMWQKSIKEIALHAVNCSWKLSDERHPASVRRFAARNTVVTRYNN